MLLIPEWLLCLSFQAPVIKLTIPYSHASQCFQWKKSHYQMICTWSVSVLSSCELPKGWACFISIFLSLHSTEHPSPPLAQTLNKWKLQLWSFWIGWNYFFPPRGKVGFTYSQTYFCPTSAFTSCYMIFKCNVLTLFSIVQKRNLVRFWRL